MENRVGAALSSVPPASSPSRATCEGEAARGVWWSGLVLGRAREAEGVRGREGGPEGGGEPERVRGREETREGGAEPGAIALLSMFAPLPRLVWDAYLGVVEE